MHIEPFGKKTLLPSIHLTFPRNVFWVKAANASATIKQLMSHVCVFNTKLLLSTKCLDFDNALSCPVGLTVLAW